MALFNRHFNNDGKSTFREGGPCLHHPAMSESPRPSLCLGSLESQPTKNIHLYIMTKGESGCVNIRSNNYGNLAEGGPENMENWNRVIIYLYSIVEIEMTIYLIFSEVIR